MFLRKRGRNFSDRSNFINKKHSTVLFILIIVSIFTPIINPQHHEKASMRFRLLLEVNKRAFGNQLPINCQYEQSAAVYKILSNADKAYAAWLHDNGFQLANRKTFKLFTYSRFKIEKRRLIPEKERLQILSDTVEWQISFLPEKSTEKFIQGVFQDQVFEIGDTKSVVQFIVRSVEVMPEPDYSERMVFATMSPLCLKFRRFDGKVNYLSPTDARAPFLLFNGLFDKYKLFYGKDCPYTFSECKMKVLDTPKSALIKVKAGMPEETRVRGFMCKLEMEAPVELMRLMYEGGVGSLNSQGFGCLRVVE